MKKNHTCKKSILKDLEEIYRLAIEKENFSVALKAKELLGRECGLFALKKSENAKGRFSLDDLSDEDIKRLIEEIEQQLVLDHQEQGE